MIAYRRDICTRSFAFCLVLDVTTYNGLRPSGWVSQTRLFDDGDQFVCQVDGHACAHASATRPACAGEIL